MALMAYSGVLSDEEIERLISNTRPDAIIWLQSVVADAVQQLREVNYVPIFMLYRARPHTDDMMAMLDDLGIDPPPARPALDAIAADWTLGYEIDWLEIERTTGIG